MVFKQTAINLSKELPMGTDKTFQPGEIVIKEGARGTSAYIILSGAVEVFKKSGDREVLMATLDRGQVFGEMGLIENRPRSATVRAITDLKVRRIDREHFNELLQKKPSVLIPIIKSLFERLRQASDMLAERSAGVDMEMGEERAFEVVMEGQTAEARNVLANVKLHTTKFPFLIGRDSENPDTDVFYNNDLFIKEKKPYVVSRNHMAIINEKGSMWLVDRGSAFGTVVNGREIGGQSGFTRARLDEEENQIILGPATSKFIFLLKVIPK
ncbi:MAG: cyclic nucleotide-binding domain-containing protein [Desulfobacteraceae bacterium]|jgi:CRP-like cAMP-binding protein